MERQCFPLIFNMFRIGVGKLKLRGKNYWDKTRDKETATVYFLISASLTDSVE